MTTLTLRRIKDHFVVTGPDIEPARFKSRLEARDWCRSHYSGSPITKIGPDLKGKSIEAVRRVLRREARLSLRPRRNTKVNLAAPAVKREAEEDWGSRHR
jgi:hypothetical protein